MGVLICSSSYLSGNERATIDNAVRLLDKLVAAREPSSKIKEWMGFFGTLGCRNIPTAQYVFTANGH